jgi:hypothetical protein
MKLNQLKIPTLKPRDSGHRVLAAKVNAAGPHRDKKAELKRGAEKHKGRSVYEASIEEAEGKVPHKMAGRADAIQKRLKNARLAKQRELESSYEDDDEKPAAKQKVEEKFHLSDAPEAKGKFKELSAEALADWLIKTRSGNGKRIYGSLSQQIVFNKDNPTYKKKMEATIAAVKRKLKDKQ